MGEQLLGQVELQLVKELQPLMGLFHNELPLQVLRDGRAQEPEGLSCDYSVVYGGCGRFLLKLLHIFTTLVYKRED